jgi:hypothetical protein
MPQQKILEDEFPLAGLQRTAASTARYLTIIGFWSSLNLDDVLERAAMRTFKKRVTRGRNVRRFAHDSHGTPPRCCNEHGRYIFGGPRAIDAASLRSAFDALKRQRDPQGDRNIRRVADGRGLVEFCRDVPPRCLVAEVRRQMLLD